MAKYKFGEIVKEVKEKVDRNNNPYEFFVAGDHMDTDELHILRRGTFAGNDVGPAFIRIFKPGQVLYGSRRTYLRKVAVAEFEGVTANTTFVLETKDESILLQRLLPFIMQSDRFTQFSIKCSKGSTNPYVLFSDLCDYELDLPSIDKQKELADLLWSIDGVKMSYKKLIQITDELIKSQFIEMFVIGNKYPEVALGELVDRSIKKKKEIIGQYKTINYIDISSVDNGQKEVNKYTEYPIETAPSRAQQLLQKGDILVSTVRPNLKNIAVNPYSEGNVVASTGFCVLRSSKCLPEYVWGIVSSDDFTYAMCEKASGINYPAIHDSDVLSYMVPLPPIEEQQSFATFSQQSDKSKFELEQSLKELTATYKRIINENLG